MKKDLDLTISLVLDYKKKYSNLTFVAAEFGRFRPMLPFEGI